MAKISSQQRVEEDAKAKGLTIEVRLMPDSTRTAGEAAAACGCSEAQIVKSLIFQTEAENGFALLLIAGDRQADLELAARHVGSALKRADAKAVRDYTGFAIGGVSPLGHMNPVPVFMDPSLLTHELVWAAAGKPNAVFSVSPKALCEATGAILLT